MRVLVCGSRTWSDKEAILKALFSAEHEYDEYIKVLIHGGANGADKLAGEAAREMCGYSVPKEQVLANTPEIRVFPANWNLYGKAAGFIRNQQMLDEGKPDLVLAFWDGESRGTKMMIDLAKKAGVPVKVIQ